MDLKTSNSVESTQSTDTTTTSSISPTANYSIAESDTDSLSNVGSLGYGQSSIDVADQLLFITAPQNNSIYIYDLPNAAESDIGGFNDPQSVVYASQSSGGELFVSNAGNGTVDVLLINNAGGFPITLQKIDELRFVDPGSLAYDNSTGLVFLSYGSGNGSGVGIISSKMNDELGTIPLPAHPGQIAIEQNGPSLFVSLPGMIDVIDKNTRQVVFSWPLSGVSGSSVMGLDEGDNRLFVATSNPSTLEALNDETGKVLSTMNLLGTAGDLVYDPQSGLIVASCINGVLQAFRPEFQNGSSYLLVASLPTGSLASQFVFFPSQEEIFVFIPQDASQSAQLMTFSISIS